MRKYVGDIANLNLVSGAVGEAMAHQGFEKLDGFRYDYTIENEGEEVKLLYTRTWIHHEKTSSPLVNKCLMHIRNIPAVVDAMLSLFGTTQWGGGDSREIIANGDLISIVMDTEPGPKQLTFFFNRTVQGNKKTINLVRFVFISPGEIEPVGNGHRVPTPEIIWFADTLRQVYREWEEEQKK